MNAFLWGVYVICNLCKLGKSHAVFDCGQFAVLVSVTDGRVHRVLLSKEVVNCKHVSESAVSVDVNRLVELLAMGLDFDVALVQSEEREPLALVLMRSRIRSP